MKIHLKYFIYSILVMSLFGCETEQDKEQKKKEYADILSARVIGLSYLEENKLEEAEGAFLKLIELAPDEPMGYANLGLVYLRMGEFGKAEEQLKEALDLDHDNPDARLILAKVYEQSGQKEKAIEELKNILESTPENLKALYNLSEQYADLNNESYTELRKDYLEKIVEIAPENIVPRIHLIGIHIKSGNADRALSLLEVIQKQYAEFPDEAVKFYERTLEELQNGDADASERPFSLFRDFIESTTMYQSGLEELKGPQGAEPGFPVITFSQPFTRQLNENESILESIHFIDVTELEGINETFNDKENLSQFSVGDYDNDGDPDLFYSSEKSGSLIKNNWAGRGGKFEKIISYIGIEEGITGFSSIFSDFDNDGYLDLYVVKDGKNLLYRNTGNEQFTDITDESKAGDTGKGNKALFVDLDHDGDLDLLVLNDGFNKVYRNNSDGTFTLSEDSMGISGGESNSIDAAFADFDVDGDTDIIIANKDGNHLIFSNNRQGNFADRTGTSGLVNNGNTGSLAVGDYNNDGFMDVFLTAMHGGTYQLLRNNGDGTFQSDPQSETFNQILGNTNGMDASFLDFDNDGFLDLLVGGNSSTSGGKGVFLFHNDSTGQFENVSQMLPDNLSSGSRIVVEDYDMDGDLDIFITDSDGRLKLLQNDGGNVNHFIKIRLTGLRSGSGKNNHFGIGSKVEIRAGDLYQTRVISDPTAHFGLGHRLKADVVRVLWTNGNPQNIYFPGSDKDIIEEQVLKGSCFFLYTWNGEKYVFVKDMMWRSALGMPLGIMGGETAYAFREASKEYLKIPGELLKPKDGVYTLMITEELWETAYFDEAKLAVVDHPDDYEVYVHEGFTPPPFPPLELYPVKNPIKPVKAVDGMGNDLLDLILEKDDRYISNFKPDKYQGVTEMRELILDPGNVGEDLLLFLNGWLYPTDASINISVSQSADTKVVNPYLQVINGKGEWETVISNMGFPMGKNKTMVINLTGKYLSDDRKVRIKTNMEIYWDHIFFAENRSEVPFKTTELVPKSADLHYRGFSRMYRKGGRYGPHWFDYYDVSKEQKWRDLIGNYTRYGEIQPLLLESDDKYAIVNSGDEVEVIFDASGLPELPEGWKRDFFIYSVGWIKDGDLNTAHGKTVGPLPFHNMTQYPYGDDEEYPSDPEHLKYLEEYNTREVTTDEFVNALKVPRK